MANDMANKIVNNITITPQDVELFYIASLGSGWLRLHPNSLETVPEAEDLLW